MLYRVVYEVMESDVGVIFEKVAHIEIEALDDVRGRLARELEKIERRVLVSQYDVESVDGDIFVGDCYFC